MFARTSAVRAADKKGPSRVTVTTGKETPYPVGPQLARPDSAAETIPSFKRATRELSVRSENLDLDCHKCYSNIIKRKGGESVDIDLVRSDLEEKFPMWTDRIRLLRFKDSPTANPTDNDGSTVFYNSRLVDRMSWEKRNFYMARELLHIQLSHHHRRGDREPMVWKRATDGVVHSMLRDEGFQVPEEVLLIRDGAGLAAEELYDALYVLSEDELSEEASEPIIIESDDPMQVKEAGKDSKSREIDLDDPGLARAVAGLAELLEPSMQVDYDWFPGTTIRDGMLRYDFRPYPVARTEILLDTSASVDADLLRYFVRAVKALMREDAVVRVGCFDTKFYGFKDINSEADIENLRLVGAGGTNFEVAVEAFTGDAENQIIFTDGYAEMPEQSCNAVWVVYGSMPIHPKGGRVIYAKPSEEKEQYEIEFLIT